MGIKTNPQTPGRDGCWSREQLENAGVGELEAAESCGQGRESRDEAAPQEGLGGGVEVVLQSWWVSIRSSCCEGGRGGAAGERSCCGRGAELLREGSRGAARFGVCWWSSPQQQVVLGAAILLQQLPTLWTQLLPGSPTSVLCASLVPALLPSPACRWGLILAVALPGKRGISGTGKAESGPARGACAGVSTGSWF